MKIVHHKERGQVLHFLLVGKERFIGAELMEAVVIV